MYRRVSAYNKEKGYYISKEQKLLGKKLPGSDEIVPTRPKAKDGSRKIRTASTGRTSPESVTASRIRIGATAIAAHIGKVSGIDMDVYKSCDLGTAQKIIALARYYLLTDGEPTSHIENWQLTHNMEPYGHPISEDTAHNLFVQIGSDESISQTIFLQRAMKLDDKNVLAYDSTTMSTYGENHNRARYGFNKAQDGLMTDKLFTFYSMFTRQPVCYMTVPGNIPDVSAICNATKQLDVLGLKGSEIVTDCGFCSEDNLSLLFQSSIHFITRIQENVKWVRSEVDKALKTLDDTGNMCPFEPGTYGTTVCVLHNFTKVRKHGSAKKGLKAGDVESFTRRVYIHVYVNSSSRLTQNQNLDIKLAQLRDQILAGNEDFTASAKDMIKKFLYIKKRNGKIDVTFNTRAIREAKKYNGVLTLVSNNERNTFEALRKYRKREWIEDFFEEYKQRVSNRRHRVWNDVTTDGKKVVQFIALCYYEQFSHMINDLKHTLGVKNGDHDHDLKENLDAEKALKNWLDNTSIQEIFEWFDAVEKIDVSTEYARQVWTTEVIKRDRMFLEKLGITLS